MPLVLGKTFDRNYNLRTSFLDGYYNIGVFFNKRSPFVLFSVDSDSITNYKPAKINMFKNLRSSNFCETFINLHDYKKTNLDIINQYDTIKTQYKHDINLFINETINLSKLDVNGRELYDTISIYGFTLNAYNNDFIFLIAERQNIIRKLSKKIVRTAGMQIATTESLNLINEYHNNYKKDLNIKPNLEKGTINLQAVDEEIDNGNK